MGMVSSEWILLERTLEDISGGHPRGHHGGNPGNNFGEILGGHPE
jgi:hypothetical protein